MCCIFMYDVMRCVAVICCDRIFFLTLFLYFLCVMIPSFSVFLCLFLSALTAFSVQFDFTPSDVLLCLFFPDFLMSILRLFAVLLNSFFVTVYFYSFSRSISFQYSRCDSYFYSFFFICFCLSQFSSFYSSVLLYLFAPHSS